MPVVFAGHGSPMNAVEDNPWSRGFAALGRAVPRPRAILAISAHWFVDGTFLTDAPQPATIHDFWGFPEVLHEVEYPAPGEPELVRRVRNLLGEERTAASSEWGLDHGTWSVLRWSYPAADVPVVQLSIDRRLGVHQHYALAHPLAALRDEGVLILGSGNAVHNLRDAVARMQSGSAETPDWARRFDAAVERALRERDTEGLLSLWPEDADAASAHPTPDHWLPLVYCYAATRDEDTASFPSQGFAWGSISMRSVLFANGASPDRTALE